MKTFTSSSLPVRSRTELAQGPDRNVRRSSRWTVGAATDPLEREADRVADRIVARAHSFTSISADSAGVARAKAAASAGGGATSSGPATTTGQPLSGPVQAFFRTQFGHSFEDVRIHVDSGAAKLSRSLAANALTHGSDIYFDENRYQPESPAGLRLLAHELTHVVQQRGGAPHGVDPVSGAPQGDLVQGDFWSSAGRGWEMYSGMTDEGAPFAQKLMRWRMLGLGADYRTQDGEDWDSFMAARPEIQRAMATRFATLVAGFASQPDTGNEWMGGWKHWSDTMTGVRLNELESMRLTLHGCHRIDISGRYWKGIENGVTTVKLGGVRFVWVDRADLHPGTTTELSSGAEVDDREFTAAGWDYDVFIRFTMPSISTWTVSGSSATHARGWPPVTGAPAAGWRG